MADGSKTESDYDVLYRIMTTRLSVRRMKPDPIPDEYVEKILEAGRWAMSGANGTYDMSKFMSNEDIIDYLYKLRGKTMFRYHLKDSLLPSQEKKS
jgi:nitroreductase